jgi:chitinase
MLTNKFQAVPNAVAYGYTNPTQCTDFGFGPIPYPANTPDYATEHILEFQMVTQFFDWYTTANPKNILCFASQTTTLSKCKCLRKFWYQARFGERPIINGIDKDAIDHVGYEFPGTGNNFLNEFVLLDGEVNNIKEGIWGASVARNEYTLQDYAGWGNNLFKYVKDSISVLKYHATPAVQAILVRQKNRIGARLNLLETTYLNNIHKDVGGGVTDTWASLGLQAQWNTYMRTRTGEAILKGFANVETYLAGLEEGYGTPLQRQAAQGTSAEAAAERTFLAKIDAARNEWTNNRPVWNNPF